MEMKHRMIVITAMLVLSMAADSFASEGPGSVGMTRRDNSAAVSQRPTADIRFEETLHNFGKISRSKHPEVRHTFVFRNTGTRDLVIQKVESGCGCTIPKYTRRPVKPGKRGRITVRFNARGMQRGVFGKSLAVYCNVPRAYTRIYVRGEVVE